MSRMGGVSFVRSSKGDVTRSYKALSMKSRLVKPNDKVSVDLAAIPARCRRAFMRRRMAATLCLTVLV